MEKLSLKKRIRAAQSVVEIEELLKEGGTYKDASKNSKCKWVNTALVRTDMLNNPKAYKNIKIW